jgi:CHASE2 domain-containing sensor protein
MGNLLQLAIVIGAGAFGYFVARRFVRGRLRFVDAVYAPAAPFLAAVGAAAVAWPFSLLPFITQLASALFAIGVGMGTSAGVRDLKRLALPK